MNQESKTCQNCKTQFTIEPEDFEFYAKIDVPPPTFCPDCRLQRRLAVFNILHLYRRQCDLCKKESFSMYPPDAPYTVYCTPCWWSDNWDSFSYGRDYDFSRPFFEQFNELLRQVPLLALSVNYPKLENSPYVNDASNLKNCYLVFAADQNENCADSFYLINNTSVFDSFLMSHCDQSYDCMNSYKDSRCIGNRHQVTESIECVFCRDTKSSQNCFGSANLRNKKYYIFNQPYTKEEYFEEIKKWDLGSYTRYKEAERLAHENWKQHPPNPDPGEFNTNVSGSSIFQSKNCTECYEVIGAEDSKYIFMVFPPVKDCYDISSFGLNLELAYECRVAGEQASNVRFCNEIGIGLTNAEYSKLSLGSSNHFGCVSIKKGDYVIFNKRYSPEQFQELRQKIIAHMNAMPYTDKQGRVYQYGEFFPIEISPDAYNNTLAQSFFPLTKEEVLERGYTWKDLDAKEYVITTKADELPDHIKDVPLDIVKEVIGCLTCGRGYRIIQMELDFLRQMNLPLPRTCPFCRIDEKFKLWVKNLTLGDRVCDKCQVTFRTHHIKEDAPIIWCKQCYQAEVA